MIFVANPEAALPAVRVRRFTTVTRIGLVAIPVLPSLVVATRGPGVVRSLANGAHLQPDWVGFAFMAMVAVYTCSWLAISVASGQPLPWKQSVGVQIGGVFLNRVVPAGIGSKVLNARYLNRRGYDLPQAAAIMTLVSAGDIIAPLMLGALAGAYLVSRHAIRLDMVIRPLVSAAPFLVVGGIAVVAGVLVRLWRRRSADVLITARFRQARSQLGLFIGHLGARRRHIWAVAAILAVQRIIYGAIFVFIVHAAGGHVAVFAGLSIYLFGSLAASAIPVVGGLGATEFALTSGLLHAGMRSVAAATAVLAFRMMSYWAPAIPGMFAYRVLRRSGTV